MKVKQISVFVENAKGALSRVTKILADNGINIRALSIADTTDFGILRLIVKNPGEAYDVLKKNDVAVRLTDVIVAAIDDRPSGLSLALSALNEGDVSVEYMYAFVTRNENEANVIIKTDDSEKAIKALEKAKIRVLKAKEVYEL